MAFCNVCKNNITTTATPVDLELHEKYNLVRSFSEPTNTIVLLVSHEHPGCIKFDSSCLLRWWKVLGKLN
jgi:hypothetical protein